MKMSIATIAVVFVVSCSNCSARLGETLDQCIARYGPPISSSSKPADLPNGLGESIATFDKNGVVVVAIFFKGTVGGESILKADKSAFSDTEKSVLMDADCANQTWNKMEGISMDERYVRADGSAYAICQNLDHALCFYSKDYFNALQAKQAADQKDNLKSF